MTKKQIVRDEERKMRSKKIIAWNRTRLKAQPGMMGDQPIFRVILKELRLNGDDLVAPNQTRRKERTYKTAPSGGLLG
jgi:hypothetical protein